MKIDETTAKLICELEYLVGSECYNPNSYDGWTGIAGKEYRYPVYALDKEGDEELTKFRGNVGRHADEFTEKTIRTMKYKFGSNHLFIGNGILNILDTLEKRYGIDFNDLENNRKEE